MAANRASEGVWLALSAYLFWGGIVPVYFKLVDQVPLGELIVYRVVWSLIFLLGLLTVTKSWHNLRISPKKIFVLMVTSLILLGNWLIFIWAVLHDMIAETALGYFINPLVSVFLGMIFLGESLRPLQWIAIAFASSGIIYQLIFYGAVPWIALILAFSFGVYGLLRKNLNLASVAGLTIEILMLTPVALVYLAWLIADADIVMGSMGWETDLLLVASGIVTIFPLLCFAAAVTRLSLTAIGIIQYVSPSLALIVAVQIYGEPFGTARLVTFSCIWVALIIFACESVYHQRKQFSVLQPDQQKGTS